MYFNFKMASLFHMRPYYIQEFNKREDAITKEFIVIDGKAQSNRPQL